MMANQKQRQLFTVRKDCPICKSRASVEIPTQHANFFRCSSCHQAIKQNPDGSLGPWLDFMRAGKKNKRRQAEGRKWP